MLRRAALAVIATSLLAQASLAVSAPGKPPAAATAHAARSVHVHDSGHLTYHSVAATSIIDDGPVSGTIPGKARVDFIYNGSPKVTARFTISAADGSIDGQAHCLLKDPTSLAPSFRGALTITGGSGRYAHASGKGELFGVFHRRGYTLAVQAVGELRY